ncbi:MAG: hypothetical protein IJR87_04530 [Bacteroidaceae bacterium]|nr:hypothetical protein [Bacteroidaceae bacterium]
MRRITTNKRSFIVLLIICSVQAWAQKQYSGIYPSLAFFNDEHECGTGAVVPWAGRLWVITYGPHFPRGSSDKLYEITPDMQQIVHEESIGGTPANRMIHRESNQLFIGPYAIDTARRVRTILPSVMPGRLTGIARSVTDPAHRLWIGTMEEGFYDVGVDSLDVKTVFMDGNEMCRRGMLPTIDSPVLKGVHGKGFYSGQGVYVYANNGEESQEALKNPRIESGVLAEFDGQEWKQIRRNQFTEVTGPGGIYGNPHPESDPLWAVGWDHRSLILATRDASQGWRFFRLPKASNSYDGAHGWNTEWPRIRNVSADSTPHNLMTMHGMMWDFPQTFAYNNCYGLRPLSSYLKVVGDFCYWNGRVVFGCDDSAKSEFLNKRKAKGGIAGPGQSHSNLWFVDTAALRHLGPTEAAGSVWQAEAVEAGSTSEPFLLAGWKQRTAWLGNGGSNNLNLTFETDKKGNGQWKKQFTKRLLPNSSGQLNIKRLKGEWIRVKTDRSSSSLTVSFVYAGTTRPSPSATLSSGLSPCGEEHWQGGLLYCLGSGRKALGIVAHDINGDKTTPVGYYELDGEMNLKKKESPADSVMIVNQLAIPVEVLTIDDGSYKITDDSRRTWRLPLGNHHYAQLMDKQQTRICREVATERDLFNCGGTFYELPAENADGYAKIRPVCTHNLQIHDYASYRGLLVMTGTTTSSPTPSAHLIASPDGKCQVWAGAIDDLWQLGKPRGEGGPWVNTDVTAGEPSDPYLLGHYDHKTLTLSHSAKHPVDFTIEIDPTGDGNWLVYRVQRVKPGKRFKMHLPDGHIGKWIRFTSNTSTQATTWLIYQ